MGDEEKRVDGLSDFNALVARADVAHILEPDVFHLFIAAHKALPLIVLAVAFVVVWLPRAKMLRHVSPRITYHVVSSRST